MGSDCFSSGSLHTVFTFRVLFPLAVFWVICLLQERSSDMFKPRYMAFFCGLECYAMDFIVINNRVLYLSDSLSHDSSFDRSLCKSWQSDWFAMVSYIILSSANSLRYFIVALPEPSINYFEPLESLRA